MRLRWTSEGEDKVEEERTVCQFHYSLWPDHGIPTQVRPLLEMVRLIRDCQASETLPVLIHCSAGCGRTGTVCAIDYIWGLLRTGKLTSDFNLFNLVRDMRKQRIAMVQTLEQYVLVHRAVKELFLEQLRVIDSHPYENVDDDGHPLADETKDTTDTDYETVVVNNSNEDIKDHETRSEVIDQVLSLRMAQKPPMMGVNAMLSNSSKSSSEMSSMLSSMSNFDSLERPPQPPPKQRNVLLDANKIDTKTVHVEPAAPEPSQSEKDPDIAAEFNKINMNLFEPPGGNNNKAEPQKFKKGNLKLTQDEKGNWKIEENLEEAISKISIGTSSSEISTSNNKSSSKKSSPKRNKKDSSQHEDDKDSSPQSMLLRRPSIKKIKAFFQQQKEASADLVSEAVAKLPTYGHESKSTPSSLDRKSGGGFSSLEKRPAAKPQGPRNPHAVVKSVSSERLLLTSDQPPNCLSNTKPNLPIKRSKSMKTIQVKDQETCLGEQFQAPKAVIPPPKPKRSLTNHDPEAIKAHLSYYYAKNSPVHSRQNSMEEQKQKSLNHLVMAKFDLAEQEASKVYSRTSSNDYANVQIQDGQMIAALAAQRKLSEASIYPVKSRERRNSFREAVETKSYEPIWFEPSKNSKETSQMDVKSSPIYANVQPKRASPVRKVSAELTSVSLVSEVNRGLNKQNSNSSLTSSLSGQSLTNGKGPPPPYVEPPRPGNHRSSVVKTNVAAPQVPTSNAANYANVQFRVKGNFKTCY